MNNKERFLSKIGKLIEKGGVTEEELASFFQPDEPEAQAEGAEAPKEEPKVENAQAEVAEGDESPKGEPSEAEAEAKQEQPLTAQDNNVAQAETPLPEATAEAKTPENPVSMDSMMERLDSLAKAVEGMSRENEALRKALKEANVLCDQTPDQSNPIGLDGNATPSKADGEDNASVLAKLNRGRY